MLIDFFIRFLWGRKKRLFVFVKNFLGYEQNITLSKNRTCCLFAYLKTGSRRADLSVIVFGIKSHDKPK